jgi:hypothetical protein
VLIEFVLGYLLVGMLYALGYHAIIRHIRRHARDGVANREENNILKEADSPGAAWRYTIAIVFLWVYFIARFTRDYLAGLGDDDDDPQDRVPPRFR